MYDPWTRTKGWGENAGGRGHAGRREIKRGKWDNCKSIINKTHFLKEGKIKEKCPPQKDNIC